jgi:hypothetical protein
MFLRLTTLSFMAFFTLAMLSSTSHAAKIYHWVDEQGRSHYSENLPRDKQAEAMNVKPAGTGSPSSSSVSSSQKTNKDNAAKTTTDAKTLKAEVSAEDKAKYCQQSRQLLQQMNGNVQRRFEQPDGSYRKLTEAEIAEYKAQAQEGINNYCQ